MNKNKTILLATFIVFMLSLYAGFIYTLSMLTEVTQLNFFTDFLDPSVTTYVDESQSVNRALFEMSLIIIVISAVMYGFGIGKKILSWRKLIYGLLVGIISLVVNLISYIQMVELNALYDVTNITWPDGIPNLFGYEEPNNLFVGSGPMIYMILMGISMIFIVTMVSVLYIHQKGKNHEKTS